ncbi:energy transducer TonB [Pseudomonas frederiksbergensis]|uniref:Protein TonB n=1 Tax=Pseudomonas frederiksbergensis TaxID=104087 RepID=A0A423KPB5_9PSED|nr:energy transducer TonB [Pseudomonas frederiksbergensis]RON56478.1 energy transducer TonB [Pseudomonas frederiksbergensis]
MRWFALVLLFVVSGVSWAGEVFLVPENSPKPVYPRALSRAGITGDVRVGFTAHSDGSVSKVSVLESDHPELAESARIAVSQWRFRPWTASNEQPGEVEVVAPMAFRLNQGLPLDANKWLTELRCREVNEELRNVPEGSWVDSSVFNITRGYLSNAFPMAQLSRDQRLALIAKLNKSVPGIVWGCRSSPVSRYVKYLPADVRKLL